MFQLLKLGFIIDGVNRPRCKHFNMSQDTEVNNYFQILNFPAEYQDSSAPVCVVRFLQLAGLLKRVQEHQIGGVLERAHIHTYIQVMFVYLRCGVA